MKKQKNINSIHHLEAKIFCKQKAELRDRIGKQAKKKQLSTFDIACHARQVESVYERLLQSGKGFSWIKGTSLLPV